MVDNAAVHPGGHIAEVGEAAGCQVICLPPNNCGEGCLWHSVDLPIDRFTLFQSFIA